MARRLTVFLLVLTLGAIIYGSSLAQSTGRQAADEFNLYLPLASRNLPPLWIGPQGGTIPAVAFAPSDPGILFAGSWGAGVFKSNDGGSRWQAGNLGLGNLLVNSLAVHPQDPQIVYAGTYKGGLYKSQDGGSTWFLSSSGIQEQAIVYSILIDPIDPQRMYAATRGVSNNNNPPWNGVVYRSMDGGASWERSLYNLGGSDQQDWAYALALHPLHPNVLYAATHEHGPYRSDDYGRRWEAISTGISNFSTRALAVDPTTSSSGTVYTGVWTRSGVFKSTNGGESWSLRSNGISGAQIYGMALDPLQPETLFLATYNMGVMKTTDGADEWFPSGLQGRSPLTVQLVPAESQQVFSGTSGSGLYRSLDGGASWHPSQSGLTASSVTALIADPLDGLHLLASLYGGGVWQSGDQGSTWSELGANLGDLFVHSIARRPGDGRLFALTESAGLYYCDPGGECWAPVHSGLPGYKELEQIDLVQPAWDQDHPFASRETLIDVLPARSSAIEEAAPLLALQFAPSNPEVAYLGSTGGGVYLSVDGGDNWTPAGLPGRSILSLAIDPLDEQLVYAATSLSGEVWTSLDAGLTWNSTGMPPVSVFSLAVSPLEPGVVYAGSSNGVYRMEGGGWAQLGLSGRLVTVLVPHPNQAEVLLAGTSDGLYLSSDGGLTWSVTSSELAGKTIQSISFDPQDMDRVYVSTKTHGILRTSLQHLAGH